MIEILPSGHEKEIFMKYIMYIILAIAALIYCFRSPIQAEKQGTHFILKEGVIVPIDPCESEQDDDADEYSIYPQAEDIG